MLTTMEILTFFTSLICPIILMLSVCFTVEEVKHIKVKGAQKPPTSGMWKPLFEPERDSH
jgi:hypothetical protein